MLKSINNQILVNPFMILSWLELWLDGKWLNDDYLNNQLMVLSLTAQNLVLLFDEYTMSYNPHHLQNISKS